MAGGTGTVRVLELFAGNYSFGREALALGHDVTGVDILPCPDDLLGKVRHFQADMSTFNILSRYDVIWASPPCTTFSVASFPAGHRAVYTGTGRPYAVSDKAKAHDWLVKKTLHIMGLADVLGIMENPRGLLRKMPYMDVANKNRVTVSYCQYGDFRMKPTDLWFFPNVPDKFDVRMCKNGAACHERAPRGSKSGTQGKDKASRSHVPQQLCREILEAIE